MTIWRCTGRENEELNIPSDEVADIHLDFSCDGLVAVLRSKEAVEVWNGKKERVFRTVDHLGPITDHPASHDCNSLVFTEHCSALVGTSC